MVHRCWRFQIMPEIIASPHSIKTRMVLAPAERIHARATPLEGQWYGLRTDKTHGIPVEDAFRCRSESRLGLRSAATLASLAAFSPLQIVEWPKVDTRSTPCVGRTGKKARPVGRRV